MKNFYYKNKKILNIVLTSTLLLLFAIIPIIFIFTIDDTFKEINIKDPELNVKSVKQYSTNVTAEETVADIDIQFEMDNDNNKMNGWTIDDYVVILSEDSYTTYDKPTTIAKDGDGCDLIWTPEFNEYNYENSIAYNYLYNDGITTPEQQAEIVDYILSSNEFDNTTNTKEIHDLSSNDPELSIFAAARFSIELEDGNRQYFVWNIDYEKNQIVKVQNEYEGKQKLTLANPTSTSFSSDYSEVEQFFGSGNNIYASDGSGLIRPTFTFSLGNSSMYKYYKRLPEIDNLEMSFTLNSTNDSGSNNKIKFEEDVKSIEYIWTSTTTHTLQFPTEINFYEDYESVYKDGKIDIKEFNISGDVTWEFKSEEEILSENDEFDEVIYPEGNLISSYHFDTTMDQSNLDLYKFSQVMHYRKWDDQYVLWYHWNEQNRFIVEGFYKGMKYLSQSELTSAEYEGSRRYDLQFYDEMGNEFSQIGRPNPEDMVEIDGQEYFHYTTSFSNNISIDNQYFLGAQTRISFYNYRSNELNLNSVISSRDYEYKLNQKYFHYTEDEIQKEISDFLSGGEISTQSGTFIGDLINGNQIIVTPDNFSDSSFETSVTDEGKWIIFIILVIVPIILISVISLIKILKSK